MLNRRHLLAMTAGLVGGMLSPPARAAEPLRILCFGDSLMAGFGLPTEDHLPAVLTRKLGTDNTPSTEMVVEALSGDTSYGGIVRIHWALRQRLHAAIIAIGANDMLLGWPAERTETNLDRILDAASVKGRRPVLLAGVGAVGGSDAFRTKWDAIWPRLAARHGCHLVEDLYAPIRSAPDETRRALLQSDGLHPSPVGVAAIADAALPAVRALIHDAAERQAEHEKRAG